MKFFIGDGEVFASTNEAFNLFDELVAALQPYNVPTVMISTTDAIPNVPELPVLVIGTKDAAEAADALKAEYGDDFPQEEDDYDKDEVDPDEVGL